MMYALNLAADSRILSATYPQYASVNAVVVDTLPEGNIYDYQYINSEFIYNPIPVEEPIETPSRLDVIEAKLTYIAMMADLTEVL